MAPGAVAPGSSGVAGAGPRDSAGAHRAGPQPAVASEACPAARASLVTCRTATCTRRATRGAGDAVEDRMAQALSPAEAKSVRTDSSGGSPPK